jgi:hypothetical protein
VSFTEHQRGRNGSVPLQKIEFGRKKFDTQYSVLGKMPLKFSVA